MTTYKIDAAHSEISFKVKHLMISNVTGNFTDFEATLTANEEDFSDATISFTAQVDSINTNNAQRDGHLKSADFFDAQNFPSISFESVSFSKKRDNVFELVGNLSIKGNTKSVSLEVEYNGTMQDPYGQTKAGFELIGKISRSEFGLTWSAITEAGGVVVSDDIKLHLNIQMIKQ
ncbi:MAG: YceI family protein [Chitinophagaceae bacterium]